MWLSSISVSTPYKPRAIRHRASTTPVILAFAVSGSGIREKRYLNVRITGLLRCRGRRYSQGQFLDHFDHLVLLVLHRSHAAIRLLNHGFALLLKLAQILLRRGMLSHP